MSQAWNDINDPGVYKSPAKNSGKTQQTNYETDNAEKNDKLEPEVKLVSATWEPGEAGLEFNKKCSLNIKAEFLKETFRKKITCSLFVLYNGNEEDVKHKVDAYLDSDGNAKADMTLYYGNEYYDAAQENPQATCQYKAKIAHPTATAVLESEFLDMPQCMAADFVEIADIHFHHNCALPCLNEKGELIGLLGAAFSFAKDNPDRELIVEGHADSSGPPDYNLTISKRRAEAIKALLENDMALWNSVVTCKDHKLETEDYQQTLKGLAEKYSWGCDPGAVDNKDGPKTKEGVKGFQTEYNSRYNGTLTVDGVVGPKTWEAIGITIRSLLEEHLKNDLTLDPAPSLTYGYPDGSGIYPCGESCPIENAGNSDYKSAENRRVELVFYKKDDPTPAIAPSAGREIGLEKDPVSEKEWKKKKVEAIDVIEDLKVVITDIPHHFAPAAESCAIKYRVQDGDPPSGSKGTVVIKDNSGAVIFEKQDVQLEKNIDNQFVWDGKGTDGKLVPFGKSPFKFTLQKTGDPSTQSPEKTSRVEIAEIILQIKGINSANQFIENIPDKEIEVIAAVYLKKSEGGKTISNLPIEVTFAFDDPAPTNRSEADSYQYTSGKYLGKVGNSSSIYWKTHPDCVSSSADGYKTKCKVITVNTSGAPDIGKAKIHFKPSNVGGDNFKIQATIYADDGTSVLASKESPTFTIWRQVTFSAYEIVGATQVTTHATETKMNAYYTSDTNTWYQRGAINSVGATYSITYIGLWDHSTLAQRNWSDEQKKTLAETPIDEERTNANGPAGPTQITARNAIQKKANAWRDRIVNNMMSGLNNWATDAGVPANALVAISYFHPKYNLHAPQADAITNEWSDFPWLTITFKGNTIHPDQRWYAAESSAYQTRAYILAGLSAARYEVAIAHEIGHVTKDQFKRGTFGPSDHSSNPGLMDPTGSIASFSTKEKEILRGFKP